MCWPKGDRLMLSQQVGVIDFSMYLKDGAHSSKSTEGWVDIQLPQWKLIVLVWQVFGFIMKISVLPLKLFFCLQWWTDHSYSWSEELRWGAEQTFKVQSLYPTSALWGVFVTSCSFGKNEQSHIVTLNSPFPVRQWITCKPKWMRWKNPTQNLQRRWVIIYNLMDYLGCGKYMSITNETNDL